MVALVDDFELLSFRSQQKLAAEFSWVGEGLLPSTDADDNAYQVD